MRRSSIPFRPRLNFSAEPPVAHASVLTPEQAQQFRALILPHLDAAYNLARYLARDTTAAEDIVQNAFLRAFRAFPNFHGQAPKAWLFTIVRNCSFDWIKAHHTPNMELEDAECAISFVTADHDTPERIVSRNQDASTLRTTIESLPEPFRETLVLRELDELSYKEIAVLTQVPIGTVMSRLARARDMLVKLLLPLFDQNQGAAI